jgi:hypothetical protein
MHIFRLADLVKDLFSVYVVFRGLNLDVKDIKIIWLNEHSFVHIQQSQTLIALHAAVPSQMLKLISK